MAKDAVKPIYVLNGSDAFQLDSARREVIATVIGDADPQVCVSHFDDTAQVADVLDGLRTLPFLAERRAVVVSPADDFVSANREALEKYAESPSTSSVLVLVVSSWPGNTRLAKIVARVGKVIDCSPPARAGLGRWVAAAAKKRGKTFAPQAAELLEQWVGPDYSLLDSEIEKLSLYVGSRATIDLADVSAVVVATAGPEAFDLTNAITAGDAAAALKALGGLLAARGDEFRTLGMLAWHLRRALAAAEKLRAGVRPKDTLPNMPQARQDDFLAMLKRRPAAIFRNDFRRLLRADLAMKSGADPAAALQELVIRLCQPSPAPR